MRRCGNRIALIVLAGVALSTACAAWEAAAAGGGGPKACIIDIDGTIADESARRKAAAGEDGVLRGKEYEAYFDPARAMSDRPITTARATLRWLAGRGIAIFYVSSRPSSMLESSKKWLRKSGFPEGRGIFHKKEKYEKSLVYKTRVVEGIISEGYDVLFGVGDRDKDIRSYRAAGIVGIKVAPNDDGDWKRVRKQIEKILAENR